MSAPKPCRTPRCADVGKPHHGGCWTAGGASITAECREGTCTLPEGHPGAHQMAAADLGAVEHPAYYAALNPEPLDVAVAWGLSYPAGCVLKYLARHGRKPGVTALEDLTKARAYLDRMILEASR